MALNRKGTRRTIFIRNTKAQSVVLNASLTTRVWDVPKPDPKPTSGRVWSAGGVKYMR